LKRGALRGKICVMKTINPSAKRVAPQTQCTTQLSLRIPGLRRVDVSFDAPEVSSDGGALLLRAVDEEVGLTAAFAAALRDRRDPTKVVHEALDLCRQRIYGIALGYEDCNDARTLAGDPVLKAACGRAPDSGVNLASQPTLSRFENAVRSSEIRSLRRALEDQWLASLSPETEVIVLDLDATDDPVHGGQQLSLFNGFYDQHMYLALLVFDGEGRLVTAALRPGTTHPCRGAASLVARLIRKVRRRFPEALIVVRADAAFSMPAMLERLERLDRELGGVDFLFGLARNRVLERKLEPAMEVARERYRREGKKVREFTEFAYAARTWTRARRVVGKAEYGAQGANPRFVITSLEGFPPEVIYRAYCERGRCENFIKDLKNALAGDRLSCTRFQANEFRLLLHAAAYCLLYAVRERAGRYSQELGRAQMDTLRLRLLKVGALVREAVRRIHVRLPRSFAFARVFAAVATGVDPPPLPA